MAARLALESSIYQSIQGETKKAVSSSPTKCLLIGSQGGQRSKPERKYDKKPCKTDQEPPHPLFAIVQSSTAIQSSTINMSGNVGYASTHSPKLLLGSGFSISFGSLSL